MQHVARVAIVHVAGVTTYRKLSNKEGETIPPPTELFPQLGQTSYCPSCKKIQFVVYHQKKYKKPRRPVLDFIKKHKKTQQSMPEFIITMECKVCNTGIPFKEDIRLGRPVTPHSTDTDESSEFKKEGEAKDADGEGSAAITATETKNEQPSNVSLELEKDFKKKAAI